MQRLNLRCTLFGPRSVPPWLFGNIDNNNSKKESGSVAVCSREHLLIISDISSEYRFNAVKELSDALDPQPVLDGGTTFLAPDDPRVPQDRQMPRDGRQIDPHQFGQFTHATLTMFGQLVDNHQPGRVCQGFDNRRAGRVLCLIQINHRCPTTVIRSHRIRENNILLHAPR